MIVRAEDTETDPDLQGSYMDEAQEADYEAYEAFLSDCERQAEDGDEEDAVLAANTVPLGRGLRIRRAKVRAEYYCVPTTRCIELAHLVS
jgi:hypothetical protein